MTIRLQSFLPYVATLALALAATPDLFAQPGGGGGRGGRGGGPGGGGMAGLLMSEEIRTELGIDEDQMLDLEDFRDEMRGQMREMFGQMRDMDPDERREMIQEMRTEAENRLKEVLKPEQMTRLKQIELQQQMQRRGGGGAIPNSVAEELGLSESQLEEMRAKAAAAQAELQKKIQELRQAAQEEILSVLTSEQRAKYDELVGKPFEMPRRQFRGRGERGGRGGERGGRGGEGGRPELE